MTIRRTLIAVSIFVAGLIVGLAIPAVFVGRVDTEWRPLTTGTNHFGVGYHSSVVFSDLPMADIKSVSGKAKFLDPARSGETTDFGYLVNVEMAPLDLSKVPQKYKVEKKSTYEGQEITTPPVEQAYYDIEFNFDLRDKDGFLLQTIHGKTGTLETGKTNTFQTKIDEHIPYDIANKVSSILVHPSIVKCHTCER